MATIIIAIPFLKLEASVSVDHGTGSVLREKAVPMARAPWYDGSGKLLLSLQDSSWPSKGLVLETRS
jgi:hypothetical protein